MHVSFSAKQGTRYCKEPQRRELGNESLVDKHTIRLVVDKRNGSKHCGR